MSSRAPQNSRTPRVLRRTFDQLVVHRVHQGNWLYPDITSNSLVSWPFLVLYTKSGDVELEVGDATRVVPSGRVTVVRNDPMLRVRCDAGGSAVLLCLPRATLEPFRDAFDELAHEEWHSAGGGASGIVARVLDGLADDMEGYTPSSPGRFAHHLVGLLAVMLTDSVADGSQPDGEVILTAAKEFIEVNLASVRLSPETVAASQFVSTRTLHRLFAAEGRTVADWIRRLRLERCRIDLDDPSFDSSPVSAIGARWGLPDAPHFCRMFKVRYGCTPGVYRERRREFEADPRSSRPVDVPV